jgi:hypothetical protein
MVLKALGVLYRSNHLKVEALGENDVLIEQMLHSALLTRQSFGATP